MKAEGQVGRIRRWLEEEITAREVQIKFEITCRKDKTPSRPHARQSGRSVTKTRTSEAPKIDIRRVVHQFAAVSGSVYRDDR